MQTTPTADLPTEQIAVRVTLMQEELDEYRRAAEAGDLTGLADALSDLLYVVFGTYIAHGLQEAASELFAEVHRSNMSKLDGNGQPIFRADGKVLKSNLFSGPELNPILEKYLP
jgi:predicted HAD superfamily Cof-like phosphohydrolase